MDWKQGLTAAVVVGLGYLGFQNVRKGAEDSLTSAIRERIYGFPISNHYDTCSCNANPCNCSIYCQDCEKWTAMDEVHEVITCPHCDTAYEDNMNYRQIWGAESFSADTDSVKFARCNNLIQELDKEFNEGSRKTLSKEEWNEVFSKHIVVGTFEAESFAAEITVCDNCDKYPVQPYWPHSGDDNISLYECDECGSLYCNECLDYDEMEECCHAQYDKEREEIRLERQRMVERSQKREKRKKAESPDRFPHNPHPNPYQRPKRNAESFSADDKKVKQALKRVGPLANEVQEIGKTLKDSLKD